MLLPDIAIVVASGAPQCRLLYRDKPTQRLRFPSLTILSSKFKGCEPTQ